MGEEHEVEEKGNENAVFLGTRDEERNSFHNVLFLNPMIFYSCITARPSAPPISITKSNAPPTACPM
jgi:hypothetical protein